MKELKNWVIAVLTAIIGVLGGLQMQAGALTTNFTDANVSGCWYVGDICMIQTNQNNGGGVTATSSPANGTFVAAELTPENVVEITPSSGTGAITLTFPASTTFPLPTTPGAWREFAFFNATTSATGIITVAGGTGTLLEVASSTSLAGAAGLKTIAPQGIAVFTAFRKANSDIEIYMSPAQ